jgi:hypothetical protein
MALLKYLINCFLCVFAARRTNVRTSLGIMKTSALLHVTFFIVNHRGLLVVPIFFSNETKNIFFNRCLNYKGI